jgi:Tol biopolymer transport system component
VGTVGASGNLIDPQLSHDGRRVAVSVMDSQGAGDLWIYDLEKNSPTRLTFDPATDIAPIWSLDDSRIVFSTSRKNPGDLYVKDSAGTANEEPLVVSGAFKVSEDWSADGRVLLFQVIDARTRGGWDLWTYSIADRKATPFLQTPFNEILPKFSPDGRWISYTSNESGRDEVYVAPFPGPGGKWQISTEGGRGSLWTRGGREIVYRSPTDELMAVDVRTDPTFQTGVPRVLFKTRFRPPPGRGFDCTPDGERFLINLRAGEDASDPITLVQNWSAGRKP